MMNLVPDLDGLIIDSSKNFEKQLHKFLSNCTKKKTKTNCREATVWGSQLKDYKNVVVKSREKSVKWKS